VSGIIQGIESTSRQCPGGKFTVKQQLPGPRLLSIQSSGRTGKIFLICGPQEKNHLYFLFALLRVYPAIG